MSSDSLDEVSQNLVISPLNAPPAHPNEPPNTGSERASIAKGRRPLLRAGEKSPFETSKPAPQHPFLHSPGKGLEPTLLVT